MSGALLVDDPFTFVAWAALGLLGVVGLVYAWRAQRGQASAASPIELVGIRSMGGKRLLALVQVDDQRFLLGMTDERISCLGEVGAPEGQAASEPAVALAQVHSA